MGKKLIKQEKPSVNKPALPKRDDQADSANFREFKGILKGKLNSEITANEIRKQRREEKFVE